MAFLVRALAGASLLKVGQAVRIRPHRGRSCPDDPSHHVIAHDFAAGSVVHILPSDPAVTNVSMDQVPPGFTPPDMEGDYLCMWRPDETTQYVHHSEIEVID